MQAPLAIFLSRNPHRYPVRWAVLSPFYNTRRCRHRAAKLGAQDLSPEPSLLTPVFLLPSRDREDVLV